jgi:4-amino-4-deoxy-L-arabinose transferase-like glycosyltransferase
VSGRVDWRLAALIALVLVPGIGLFPLFDVDEGAFSEATREMLASGDWLSTTLNGLPRFDKPILIYWLQALSVQAFGLDELALRLPSALAAFGWALAIAAFARPRFGATTAALAAWIGATCAGVLVIGRAATADALLNLLLALAMFDLWRHLENGGRGALRRTYLWIGLGVLTKGPIAILIPAAVAFLWCLLDRSQPLGQRLARWLHLGADPLGWLIGLTVAAPWYAYALAVHGRAFIDGFILKHNVERFSGTLEGHRGSILYYVVFAPLLLLPWTGLLAPALRRLRADCGEPLARFLWLWCAFVIAFFSLSGTKLPHYALYGLTPLFVLLARARDGVRRPAGVLAWPTVMLLLLPAAPWLAHWAAQRDANPSSRYYVAMMMRSLDAAPAWFYVASGGAAAIWLAALVARRAACWQLLALAAGLQAFVLAYALAPWLGEVLNAPVKRAALVARAEHDAAVQWNINVPSFSVYLGQSTPAREPAPGELAVTRLDRLPEPLDGYRELYREGGVVLLERER